MVVVTVMAAQMRLELRIGATVFVANERLGNTCRGRNMREHGKISESSLNLNYKLSYRKF